MESTSGSGGRYDQSNATGCPAAGALRKCKERKAEDAKQRKERKAEDCKGKKVEEGRTEGRKEGRKERTNERMTP